MLQTALYADSHAAGFGSDRVPPPFRGGIHAGRKVSFSDLSSWLVALLARDDTAALNPHLLRDIGVYEAPGAPVTGVP